MSKKNTAPKPKPNRENSWWTKFVGGLPVLTPMLVAATSLLIALTSIFNNLPSWFPTPTPTPTPTPSSFGCKQYLEGVTSIQIAYLQAGGPYGPLFANSEILPVTELHVMFLQSDTGEIGKIKFLYSDTHGAFELASVVDPGCREVQQPELDKIDGYVNNGETLPLRFGDQDFTLRLTLQTDTILGQFQ